MAATAPSGRQQARSERRRRVRDVEARAGAEARGFMAWWRKVNNDWVFNLSAMLAYNFLMSVFPILLVLLAIAGFIVGSLAPAQHAAFQDTLTNALPGGKDIVIAVLAQLNRSAGLLFVVGIVSAAFTSSRLFIALENCFGIIFRLRSRDVIHQNLMAFGMFLLYIVLIPLVFLSSSLPAAILGVVNRSAVGSALHNPVGDFFTYVLGIAVSVFFACILLGAIYVVVPNRRVQWREVWQGTLVAAALLVIYNLFFPLYERYLLHPGNYGSLAGFAIVMLVFLYYLGVILLIGAEVNSWMNGQRETAGNLLAVLHEVQAHDTTRGAAGPTAGQPQEDLQHHQGAAAMENADAAVQHEREDHHTDLKPPKPAEAHLPGPPQRTEQQREERWDEAARETGVERDGNRQSRRQSDERDELGAANQWPQAPTA